MTALESFLKYANVSQFSSLHLKYFNRLLQKTTFKQNILFIILYYSIIYRNTFIS